MFDVNRDTTKRDRARTAARVGRCVTAAAAVLLAVGALTARAAPPDGWQPLGAPWPAAEADAYAPDRVGLVGRPQDFPLRARHEMYRAYADLFLVSERKRARVNAVSRGLFDPVDNLAAQCGETRVDVLSRLGKAWDVYSKAKAVVDVLHAVDDDARIRRDLDYISYLWYWLARYDSRQHAWGKQDPHRLAYRTQQQWLHGMRLKVEKQAAAIRASACPVGQHAMTGTLRLTNTWSSLGAVRSNEQYELAATCTATLRFDGTERVLVNEKLRWRERRITSYDAGNLERRTDEWQLDGSFQGVIAGTSTITFRARGRYAVRYPIPQHRLLVDRRHIVQRAYRSSPSTVQTALSRYRDMCWDRYSESLVAGVARGESASGSRERTHDLNERRIVSRLEWSLTAAGRRR